MAIKVKPKPYDKTVVLGATTAEVVSPKVQPVKPVQPSMPTPISISNPEMVDINAANRANAAAQVPATPVSSGPAPLNRTGRELLDAELNAQGQAGFDLFGVNNPRSQGELVQKTKLEQEMERARQEQQQKTQFDIMGLQNQQVQQQMRGAEAASVAGLAQGREGPVSASAPMAMEQARTFYAQNRAILEAKTAQTNRDMLNARADLQKAQDEGNTRLASQIQSRIVSLEQEQSKANLATQQALNEAAKVEIEQSQEERAKQQNKVSNLNTFMGWVADGQTMTPQMISSFAENTGIESGPLYETYAKNQAIRDDKTLNLEQKQQAYASNAIDLQRKVKGLDDVAARQVATLQDMYKRGASAQEISDYKSAAKITDQNDPIYQAELSVKMAEAKIKQAEARGELVSPLDKIKYASDVAALAEKTGGLGVYNPVNSKYDITVTPNGIVVNVPLDAKGRPASGRVQCGAFVNDVLGLGVGDTLASKTKFIDQSIVVPSAGMAFVSSRGYDLGGGKGNSGHIGIVESANADGTFNTVETNYNGDGKLTRRQNVPVTEVLGFIRPPRADFIGAGKRDYSEVQTKVLDSLSGIDPKDIDPALITTLKNAGLTTTDLLSYQPAFKPLPPAKQAEINTILEGITTLKGMDMTGAVGTSFQKFFQLGDADTGFVAATDAANFKAQFDKFRDNLVLPSLDKLKGAMSDKDIQFLRNAATSLNLDMSEEAFTTELNRIEQKYREALGETSSDTNEVDQIINQWDTPRAATANKFGLQYNSPTRK